MSLSSHITNDKSHLSLKLQGGLCNTEFCRKISDTEKYWLKTLLSIYMNKI